MRCRSAAESREKRYGGIEIRITEIDNLWYDRGWNKSGPMRVTLELPDDIAEAIASQGDLSRRALEALVLEEFRAGRLSQAKLRVLLGFSTRYETDGFLKSHGIFVDYPEEEFERDREALRQAGF
jgi:Uncharacterised protein family (UPF0175)